MHSNAKMCTCVLMASASGCMVPEMPAKNSGCTASAAPMRSRAAPSARHSELCGCCISTGAQASSPAEPCGKGGQGGQAVGLVGFVVICRQACPCDA